MSSTKIDKGKDLLEIPRREDTEILAEFKEFGRQQRENAERENAEQARSGRERKKPKEDKLTELKKFAKSFKLATPVPSDLIDILSKDPYKQQEIKEKAIRAAESFAHNKTEAAETKEAAKPKKQSPQPQKNNQVVYELPQSKSWADVVRGTSLKGDQPIAPMSSPRSNNPTASVYSSSLSSFTRSTEATQTTNLTSVSSRSKTVHPNQMRNPNPALGLLGDIQEVEEDIPSVLGQDQTGQLLQDGPYDKDDESLISQTSTTYTPEQRDDVVVRFSQAMLKGLHSHVNYGAANKLSRQHVLAHLRSALRTFSEAVEADTSERTQAKARKMVRRLRSEIARKLQDEVLKDDQVQESNRMPINLTDREEMGAAEKINRWDIPTPDLYLKAGLQAEPVIEHKHHHHSESSMSLLTRSESSVEQSDVEVSPRDTTQIYGTSINPVEVMKHFSTHPAFEELLQTTRKLFDRFHSQKMDLVRQRTSLSIRRQLGKQGSNNSVAIFNLDWDLHGFLIENYNDGVHQDLDKILAVTGTMGNAQLCSVSQYFAWAWPGYEF
ncbi:alcohol dehydrogenase [Fusarium pseudoanthophilum]|uniref:Alcohol dehydrogenase n=1 Tax=Fusarium pseudoanthophilum TaxID=48495 RepID=A0A8H5JVW3_9HYPO|nr:alcohol dehydrogenase [Fusarium pseudoanthophilum]